MKSKDTTTNNTQPSPVWREYYELTKPRVVMLLVFTAVIGVALAPAGQFAWSNALLGLLGIGLAASSAAAINHLLDEEIDAKMARTAGRPLPTGQLSRRQVLMFAAFLGALSMLILVLGVNWLTALLTLLSLVGYAVIYTVFLKRATPQNIVIGGAAGAAPPVLGWVAITGTLDPEPWLLFLIIFAWTPPHFWALAIARRDDYAKADIPMLPVTHGIRFTSWQILFYTVILIMVTTLPVINGFAGWFYLIAVGLLNAIYMYYAVAIVTSTDSRLPMRSFTFSITYLIGVFAALLIDHFLQ